MSKDYHRRKCLRKYRYPSETFATRHARLDWARGGGMAKAYECRFCGGWHLSLGRDIDRTKTVAKP